MKFEMKLIILMFLTACFVVPSHSRAAVRTLYLGLSGADVALMQRTLISKGYLPVGKDTGYFGPLTDKALKKFQCDYKIICDTWNIAGYGMYGPRTQAALGNTPNLKNGLEFSGWIPYWRSATGTMDVLPHLDQLSSVMPFGYTMKSDGTLKDTAALTEEPWLSFFAEARKQGVKIVPDVMWGNGDSIHRILSNATTRIALEDEIAAVVKQNNFDGIDIDFEAKKYETVNYFSTFLKGLRLRISDKLIYCTVEARMPLTDRYLPEQTIPPDATHYANDYKALATYCDRVEIMAYDQGTIAQRLNAARSAPYAPVADPGWVENVITLAAQTIPKNKIIIGVPTYGYEYLVTPLPGAGYRYLVLWPFNPRYATEIAAKLGITVKRNSAGELGFTYDAKLLEPAPTGNDSTQTQQATTASTTVAQNAGTEMTSNQPFNYMSWSDAAAIADKVALARKLGVRGVAVFKFDGGEDPLMWSVLR